MAGGTISDKELTKKQELAAGTGAQTTYTWWGDYGSVTVDPKDDCTLWFSAEYLAGGTSWGTKIVSIRFPDCQPTAGPPCATSRSPTGSPTF
jgi:hypothetical protein